MQVTTITVARKRSIQPEKYGNTAAELEVTANLNDGEDWKEAARSLLISARALVFENLGMEVPDSAGAETADTTTVEVKTEEKAANDNDKGKDKPKAKPRGRPKKDPAKAADDLPGIVDDATESEPVGEDATVSEDAAPEATPEAETETAAEESGETMTPDELQSWLVEQIKTKKIDIGAARKILVEVAGVVKSNDVPDDKMPAVIAAIKEVTGG